MKRTSEGRAREAGAAAWPLASADRHFRDEFGYHATHPTKVKDPKHFEKEPF